MVFRASGKAAKKAFEHERGGHRWQRVPPTERRGRRQTSTITVAVLPEPDERQLFVNQRDLEYTTRRGSGPGGQHRNKTDSCVDLRHIPSGLVVTVDGRSQHQNKQAALQILRARLLDKQRADDTLQSNQQRRGQIGCGQRGDKRRTIRVHDDLVVDHVTGKKVSYQRYMKGEFPWHESVSKTNRGRTR